MPESLLSLSLVKVKVVKINFRHSNRELLMKSTAMTRLLAKVFSMRTTRSCSKATPVPKTTIKARVLKMATGVRIKKSRKRRRFSNLKELSLGKSISLNISREGEELKKEAMVMVEEMGSKVFEVKLIVKRKLVFWIQMWSRYCKLFSRSGLGFK